MNMLRPYGLTLSEMRQFVDNALSSPIVERTDKYLQNAQAPVYAGGGDKKNTMSDEEIMEGTSEKAIYARRLIQYAMNNPSGLWADTEEAAKARKWLRENAPEQLSSLYHGLDDDFKKTVDRRFIPTDAKEYDYAQGIRDYRDNEGVKFTLGASAIPLSVMGITEGALAAPQAISWLSQGKNLATLGRVGYDVAATEFMDRLPAYITDNKENRISKIGGRGLENAFRRIMPESRFTESAAPYVNSAGRLATFLGEGAVTDLIGRGSQALADNAAYALYKARKLKTDPVWQAREAAKKQGILYHIDNPTVGIDPKSQVPFIFKDGKWQVDADKVWSGSLRTDFLRKRQSAKRAIEDRADAFVEQMEKSADQIKNELGQRAAIDLSQFRANAGYAPSDPKEQVQWVLDQVKAGKRPPLDTKVTDMFGREVEIPEDFAAAMQTPHFNAVYPNGVDFWWRGFDSSTLFPGTNWYDVPTRYPSVFGGEYNMAKGYTAGFSGSVPDKDIVLSTEGGVPNLMLLMTPKGQFRDLGEFAGGHWASLPNVSSKEAIEAQRELSEMFEMAKANPTYSWDYMRKAELENIVRQNPLQIQELHPTHKYFATDDIAHDLDVLPKSEAFPESGVLLRDVSDGPRGMEVIYNTTRGGYPKVVSPLSTYKFDLLEKSYLKGGGRKKKAKFDKPVSWYVSQKPEAFASINKISPENLDKFFYIDDNGVIRSNLARDRFTRRRTELKNSLGEIAYNQDNEIMLTTDAANARYRTGRISTDILDYIYDNAAKAKIPFKEALGLAGKESTLGIGRGYKRGQGISPINLYSYWAGIGAGTRSNQQMKKLDKIYKQFYNGEQVDMDALAKAEAEYQKLYDSLHEFQGDNLVKAAYDYYKSGKYNPGESGYDADVIRQGEAILSDKAVKKWLETKKPYSGRGFSNGGPIHIKKKNRGKFTALKKRTGHSASWFKAHGTPAQKKMATFALNAKKWKHEHGGIKF